LEEVALFLARHKAMVRMGVILFLTQLRLPAVEVVEKVVGPVLE
jgi:hypothetical protein